MKTEITYLFIIITLLAMCYSLLAPLFPFLAASKNLIESTIVIKSTIIKSTIIVASAPITAHITASISAATTAIISTL